MRRALLYLWSAPWGLVGMLAALVAWALGWARPRWREGALELECVGAFPAWMRSRGWLGVTVGWSILVWGKVPALTWVHEREHVRQGLRLGPLFPVVYGVLLLFYGYRRHPLERAARAVAESREAQAPTAGFGS